MILVTPIIKRGRSFGMVKKEPGREFFVRTGKKIIGEKHGSGTIKKKKSFSLILYQVGAREREGPSGGISQGV